jgi:GNAT superfamily N-acetyltransferase
MIEIASGDVIKELSDFSVSVGNVRLHKGMSVASVLREEGRIIGFAAAAAACHAAGSYVAPSHRHQGLTYQLRKALEDELRTQGVPMYFAVPANDFEKMLFAKYGPVTEKLAQVKEL